MVFLLTQKFVASYTGDMLKKSMTIEDLVRMASKNHLVRIITALERKAQSLHARVGRLERKMGMAK